MTQLRFDSLENAISYTQARRSQKRLNCFLFFAYMGTWLTLGAGFYVYFFG
jgi:hypothetical protein